MPRKLPLKLFPRAAALFISAAALLSAGPAAARDYEVEIIVFDRLAREPAAHEQWDFSSARIAARLDEMRALAARASDRPVTAQLAGLESVRQDLLAANYRILATARWRQPAAFYPNAPLIPLGDGGGDGDSDGDGGGEIDAGAGNALAAGFVRVYRTALIYADLNLQLSPPLPETDDPAAAAMAWQPHYFIAEKRRLKFKQIHYFDHPLFGAILQVWPVEDEEDAAADDAEGGNDDNE